MGLATVHGHRSQLVGCRCSPLAACHTVTLPSMLMPPVRADDPIRDFYGRLMKEEGGKTSLPTKVAAAVSQRVWTGGGDSL